MDVGEFDFNLPAELIAQEPAADRTGARLLCLDRRSGAISDRVVADLPELLTAGDVLVVNNTRVFPARLLGRRAPTHAGRSGGAVECLLLERIPDECGPARSDGSDEAEEGENGSVQRWEALVHPGQKLKPGAEVVFDGSRILRARIEARKFYGRRVVRLWTENGSSVDDAIDAIGHVPLPPYIKRDDGDLDRDRYQTIFARTRGSVAAPTAGLHFTRGLLDALAARRIEIVEITLHVGYGTFQPVRVEQVEDHRLQEERYAISDATAATINRALEEHRRVIAVGTTTTRTLEAVAQAHDGRLAAGTGSTGLFIYPGFAFRMIAGLMTNFHLPRSSLLMLVAAFAGRESVLTAYRAAVDRHYRFYSYGDAMLIL